MTLDPAFSAIALSDFDLNTFGSTSIPAATEKVLGGGTQFGNVPMDWQGLGSTQVRVGFTGFITVTGTPVTVRFRLGGVAHLSDAVAGTVVHTFTIGIGAGQFIDELSPLVASPGDRSTFQITVESTAGGATVTELNGTLIVVPDTAMQAQAVSHFNSALLFSTTNEVVRAQWLVNFDNFVEDNIKYCFAGRGSAAVGELGTFRARIGGTAGAVDGTVVATFTNTSTGGDGHINGDTGTGTRPSGVQYVKITVQSGAGFAVQLGQPNLLMIGV